MLHGVKHLHNHGAFLLLMLLLGADFVFILIHFVRAVLPVLRTPLFDITQEQGFAEIYQYMKWFWIVLLFAYLLKSTGLSGYGAWILVFAYFLADDAIGLHERIGGVITGYLTFDPPMNIRLKDFGELSFLVAMGTLLSAVVAWAYRRGSYAFRKISIDMLLFVGAFLLFGMGVDFIDNAFDRWALARFLLGVLEDGGEMLVASLIFWYVFGLATNRGNAGEFLHEHLFRRPKEVIA